MSLDFSQLPQYIGLALSIIAGTGIAAAALVGAANTVLQYFGRTLSEQAANLSAALLSGAMALPALHAAGAPWPLAVLAVIAALFAPKVAYDNLTLATKKKEAIRQALDSGR